MRQCAVSSLVYQMIIVVLFTTTGCIRVEPFTFNITDVALARNAQMLENGEAMPVGVTDVFSTPDPQILLCYRLQSSSKLRITYRWYMENTLAVEHSGMASHGGICTSIVPGESGFAPGSYRAEILVEGGVFRTATFVVR